MKYHEIGERFEYDGVVLEVAEITDFSSGVCNGCYLADFYTSCYNRCRTDERDDKKDVVYKLVEQCKTKDMEQKTEIKMEEVNKETIELIKKDAEKYETPPIGVKTIPKRHLTKKSLISSLKLTRLKIKIMAAHFLKCLTSWALTMLTASSVRRLTVSRFCASSLIWSRTRDWRMPCSIRQDMRY